jgi:hypothetical protein
MSVSLNLDFEQVKALVDQLSPEEAAELSEYLRRKTALDRLERFQEEHTDIPFTDEEIAEEVEAVRRERYERQRG